MSHDKAITPHEFNTAIFLDKCEDFARAYTMLYSAVRSLKGGFHFESKTYQLCYNMRAFALVSKMLKQSTLPVIWIATKKVDGMVTECYFRRMTYKEVKKYGHAQGYVAYNLNKAAKDRANAAGWAG